MNHLSDTQELDTNVVEKWLRVDKARWKAGVMAGLLASLVGSVVSMILFAVNGKDPMLGLKVLSTIFMGANATSVGMNPMYILPGFLFAEFLGAFWGFVYSHFVFTNKFSELLAMGLVWGVFAWVFHWNLYFQSFTTIRYADLNRGGAFFVLVAWGLTMSSVKLFYREQK